MAQGRTHQLRSARTLGYIVLGPSRGLYMALGALYGLLYGLGGLIEPYKLNCGSHPVPIPFNKTNKKLPSENCHFVHCPRKPEEERTSDPFGSFSFVQWPRTGR